MVKTKVADFFCGAGGFSEGFRQKGFDVVFALDNWQPALDTHKLNHPDCSCVKMDILELDTPEKIDEMVPDVDIIIGGPPCVAFSGSNKAGKADKSLGVRLIEAYLRIIAWKKKKGCLKYWILENVPNSSGYIKEEYGWKELGLPGKGPKLTMQRRRILNAADYGAPQTRTRFFCGDFPEPDKSCKDEKERVTMRQVMASLSNPLGKGSPGKVKDPCYGFSIKKCDLTDHFYDSRVADFEWGRSRRLKEDHGYMGKMSFPEELNRPSRTVMATMSSSTREAIIFAAKDDRGNSIGYRLPTIREIATFMSFPITYQFEGSSEATKYRLVGNAVCSKIAAALAAAIRDEEGLKSINKFISLHNVRPSMDLNGTKRKLKSPKPKRNDAKFAVHVPYLKIRSYRVELDNLESNFEKGNIVWSAMLHQGTGKNISKCKAKLSQITSTMKKIEGAKYFIDDVKNAFDGLDVAPFGLQDTYCKYGESEEQGPYKYLKIIQEIVNNHFPEGKFASATIDNSNRIINVPRDSIPVRIIAALYACTYFVESIK